MTRDQSDGAFVKSVASAVLFGALGSLLPGAVWGQPVDFGPPSPLAGDFPSAVGGQSPDLLSSLALILRVILLLVGFLAVGFFIYGGFKYLTARGEERQLESAKSTMTSAILAVILIGLAYGIVAFAFRAIGSGGGSLF